MQRDFIAELLHYIYSEDKKANPMPPQRAMRFWEKINAVIQCQPNSNEPPAKGE